MYTPPFTITAKAINLIAEISAQVERFAIRMEQEDSLMLRKVNRMQTIRGTLAIEGNTLSEEQVTALIDGKHVVAPVKEVQEVRNAITAYDSFMDFNPYNQKDLLKAHGMMALGLVDNPGHFRHGAVCVAGKKGVSHIAPPADRVPLLIGDLFDWLENSQDHALIKSSVFHYEFEFIHPFQDGNGRIGRLWQTVILKEWKEVFAWLPVETLVKENQKEYYSVLGVSDNAANSTKFIEFMLTLILNTIEEIIKAEEKVTKKVTIKVTANQKKIIGAIRQNPFVTQEQLAEIVGISRKSVIQNMKKLQENRIIERVGSNKNGHWQVIKEAE